MHYIYSLRYIVNTIYIRGHTGIMNKAIQVTAWEHRCERCGHVWTTTNELPGNCRGCNSPYWNRKRVKQS